MPTPSLGYSLVIVLGRAIVLRSIRERLADTPISLSVGAEMQFDFVIAGNQVTAHGIVYKYEFTIGSPQGGQAISIGLDIQEVSVRASGRVLCPLAVRLTAEIPVALEQIDLYSRGALRLDRAAVTLNLDEASTLKVASFGLAVQDVESAA